MRNQELTKQILQLLRQGKTKKEIAFQLGKHRNTISRHVLRIQKAAQYTPEEIVNQIDNKLIQELNGMQHRDLIQYRRVVTPRKIETKEEHKYVEEKRTIEIKALLKDYDAVFERVAQRTVPQDSARKQVATPPET